MARSKTTTRRTSRSGAVKWGYDKGGGAIVLEASGEIGRKLPVHRWRCLEDTTVELSAVRSAIRALQDAPQIQAGALPIVAAHAAHLIAQLEEHVRSVLALSPRLRADLSDLDKRLRSASEAAVSP
jgi:hypothetical protein